MTLPVVMLLCGAGLGATVLVKRQREKTAAAAATAEAHRVATIKAGGALTTGKAFNAWTGGVACAVVGVGCAHDVDCSGSPSEIKRCLQAEGERINAEITGGAGATAGVGNR